MSVVERERVEEVTREVTEADVLERAAYILEEDIELWCQGIVEGHSCAGYAISRASKGLGFEHSSAPTGYGSSWFGWAAPLLGVPSIQKWNDAAGRTKAEVVARLREAAANAR